MSTVYKIMGALVVLGVAFAFGMYQGKGEKEVVIQEKVVTKEGITSIVYRDRIVTVTKVVRPDGTTEETTTTKESDKVVDKKKTDTTKDTETTTKPVLAQYSLGISAITSLETIRSLRPDYAVTAGYRALGPIWIEAGGSTEKQLTLGVRVEL